MFLLFHPIISTSLIQKNFLLKKMSWNEDHSICLLLYTLRTGGMPSWIETRRKFDILLNERSYSGGVPSCKVICSGTDNLAYVWCLFSTGSPPLVCGRKLELGVAMYLIMKMIGRHYWHVGANDAKCPVLLNILCYLSFVYLAGRKSVKTDCCCPGWGQAWSGCRNFCDWRNVLLWNVDIFHGHAFPFVLSLLFVNWLEYCDDWKEMLSHNKVVDWHFVL